MKAVMGKGSRKEGEKGKRVERELGKVIHGRGLFGERSDSCYTYAIPVN